MSILGSILSKIFPSSHPAAKNAEQASAAPAGTSTAASTGAPPTASNAPPVDIEAVMNDLAQKNREKLNWRTSIVDLMKLLGLDSSLAARKALAQELHYTGDMNDSASMNIWLHEQVMRKVAENGGKVPADLKH